MTSPTAHVDLMPSLVSLCGLSMPDGWVGDGVDLSAALQGEGEFPRKRSLFTHVGRWLGDERPQRYKSKGFSVRDERWRLVGLELFDMLADPGQEVNVFEKHPEEASRLLVDYGYWWSAVHPLVREPVRLTFGDEDQSVVELTAYDWWPTREKVGVSKGAVSSQSEVTSYLDKARMAGTRNALPGISGHWKLIAARSGNYRIRMALLPREAPKEELALLGKLRPGTAHVRAGQEEVQLQVMEGATEVTLIFDLDAGPIDLEAWFEGQLLGERKLGAFFIGIDRLGARKRPKVEFRVKDASDN